MRRSSRSGFTLMEVIVASALSVLVMAGVGAAIQFYLFQVTKSQTSIEEAQLARAIMRRIETDLKSAVWKHEIDFSSVESLAAGTATSGAATAGLPTTTGTGSTTSGSTTTDPTAEEEVFSEAMPTTVGLYGSAMELQVDISRLPRIDEYDPQYTSLTDRKIGDIPSDIKTVTYFLIQPGVSAIGHGAIGDAALSDTQFGLVRRELDRAVTQYALNNGDTLGLDASAKVLAPEVSMLQFRYFDGFQWVEEWDSEAMGCLPMAVDVIVAIRDHEMTQAMLTGDLSLVPADDEAMDQFGQIFRRVIRIPAGKPYEEETETTEETTEEDSL